MLDFGLFDCPICCEPLTIPIFQCENGHVACSSCCPKLRNKCPSCASPVGHIRNRAMENVLESVFIPCGNAKFGCTKKVSYGKESNHEKECTFSQCSCPALDCNYTGSYKDLFAHYHETHKNGFKLTHWRHRFLGDIPFPVRINISDKMVIISELEERLLFAVQCFREPYGVYVTVSCIAPSALEVAESSYQLSYTVDGHSVIYKSPEVKRSLQLSFLIMRMSCLSLTVYCVMKCWSWSFVSIVRSLILGR